MKASKLITLAMVGLALNFTPALAQRPGGGGGRSGGGHSSSSMSRSSSPSPSRSSGSFSSPSRSSSSSSRSSFSSPSRSSSSTPSRSYSTPSAPSRNLSTPSRSGSTYSGGPSRSGSRFGTTREGVGAPSRSSGGPSRENAVRTAPSRSGSPSMGPRRDGGAPAPSRSSVGGAPTRSDRPIPSGTVRPSSNPGARSGGYARPGRPGPLPPSHRPIHPAPYFYHPWHGYVVHCHPVFWDPLPLRPWYWPGFWLYCNSYWYDYHVTDVVVVRKYVQDTYNVDMITYGISGDVMYAIVRDGGDTYLQVYDKDDHLLAEQKIHKKYCNLVIDAESGGCWISKKKDKDPLLFLWADGQLLIYEAD